MRTRRDTQKIGQAESEREREREWSTGHVPSVESLACSLIIKHRAIRNRYTVNKL